MNKGQYDFDDGNDEEEVHVLPGIEEVPVGEIVKEAKPETSMYQYPKHPVHKGELQGVNDVEDHVKKVNQQNLVLIERGVAVGAAEVHHQKGYNHLQTQDHIGNGPATGAPFAYRPTQCGQQKQDEVPPHFVVGMLG